jgi:hypothetical protein
MTKEEKIEYIDLIFKEINNFKCFSTSEILFEHIKPNEKNQNEVGNFKDLVDEINLFGKNNELFRQISTGHHFELIEYGKKLKLSELSFNEFNRNKDKRNKLEVENLELQNESIKYSKKIRVQEQRIRNLDESLKTYEFIKKFWYVFFIFLSIIYKFLELTLVYIWNNTQ